jgi:hypothetical protein
MCNTDRHHIVHHGQNGAISFETGFASQIEASLVVLTLGNDDLKLGEKPHYTREVVPCLLGPSCLVCIEAGLGYGPLTADELLATSWTAADEAALPIAALLDLPPAFRDPGREVATV